jgi:hypothetical protein
MYAFNPSAQAVTALAAFELSMGSKDPVVINAVKAALEGCLKGFENYAEAPVWRDYQKEDSFKKDPRGFCKKNLYKALLPAVFSAIKEERWGDAIENWIQFQFYFGNPRTQEGAALIERLIKEAGFDPFKQEAA